MDCWRHSPVSQSEHSGEAVRRAQAGAGHWSAPTAGEARTDSGCIGKKTGIESVARGENGSRRRVGDPRSDDAVTADDRRNGGPDCQADRECRAGPCSLGAKILPDEVRPIAIRRSPDWEAILLRHG